MNDRDAQIRALVPLVKKIARRVGALVPGADADDLFGDGCIGVIRAVDSFDPAYGVSLEHYARRIIAGAMLNGIRRLDPVSERVRRTVRMAERERYALAAATGTLPTTGEMERRVPGLRRARVEAHRGTPLSIDAPLPDGERLAFALGDDPSAVVIRRLERVRVAQAVAHLPPRQRRLIVDHYAAQRPLRALSRDMDVSPQRVSQLHVLAIARLRRELAAP